MVAPEMTSFAPAANSLDVATYVGRGLRVRSDEGSASGISNIIADGRSMTGTFQTSRAGERCLTLQERITEPLGSGLA